jgi:hypothetical protein
MAVRNEKGEFLPGVIYCLVSGDLNTDNFSVFYVGESHDPDRRYRAHYTAGMNATKDSTDVYRHINMLHTAEIPWALHIVQHYGSEGPEAAEDEVLAKFLLAGCQLMNMKRGNQWWSDVITIMRKNNLGSYSEYKAWLKTREEAKEAKKVKEFTLIPPLTKEQRKLSAEKRKAAKEIGLLPSRRKKTK